MKLNLHHLIHSAEPTRTVGSILCFLAPGKAFLFVNIWNLPSNCRSRETYILSTHGSSNVRCRSECSLLDKEHCVKSIQIRSFFWPVFSRIRTECEDLRSKSPYSVRRRENADQKKLRIWILFTQWK